MVNISMKSIFYILFQIMSADFFFFEGFNKNVQIHLPSNFKLKRLKRVHFTELYTGYFYEFRVLYKMFVRKNLHQASFNICGYLKKTKDKKKKIKFHIFRGIFLFVHY